MPLQHVTSLRARASLALSSSLAILAAACGVPDGSDRDAGTAAAEAGTVDAGRPSDAGPDTGAMSPDGGRDAGRDDAGPIEPDADNDGVPTATDCDDSDATIGSESTRDCTSACSSGIETCTAGIWGACNAPTDCACATPGEMRVVSCGMCGIAAQVCGASGTWDPPGACLSQGECAAGTVEHDLARCGDSARICDATCAWRPWEVLVPPGECDPGAEDTTTDGCGPLESRTRTCSAACAWEITSSCAYRCAAPPRASRTGADPVCIPYGAFVLGDPTYDNCSPQRMVILSEFYVDRVPVSRGRYLACMTAGVCPTPERVDFFDRGTDDQHAAGVGIIGAQAFCSWDGGELITEFQWEKAARGPYPDDRRHSWGNDDGTCSHHPLTSCDEFPISLAGYPLAISPFGVRLMGVYPEITSTRYRTDWFWVANGQVDPEGPVPASSYPNYTARAHAWSGTSYPSAINRRSTLNPAYMFRCVY